MLLYNLFIIMAEADWWTSPAAGDKGGTVMVTGRRDVDKFRSKKRYNIRVEVTYDYSGRQLSDGLPDGEDAALIDRLTDCFHDLCAHEKGVVMTGIFTGDGIRDWIFYTVSLKVFQIAFNRALRDEPEVKFEFSAEEDPEWQAYTEMCDLAEVEISD